MDSIKRRLELADFLKTRRARLQPEQVGLPQIGRRRTPGLRREEVAQLAGVGLSWYTWLEQGRDISVSDQMLESLAQALQLDAIERRHLFSLAQGSVPTAYLNGVDEMLPPGHQALIDALNPIPAYVLNQRLDLVAWNEASCALFGDLAQLSKKERNVVWAFFMSPACHKLYVDWEHAARKAVETLRINYDQQTGDPQFEELITELNENSPEFREWWSLHNVQFACDPVLEKVLDHPQMGQLVFSSSVLVAEEAPAYRIVIMRPLCEETTAKLNRWLENAKTSAREYASV